MLRLLVTVFAALAGFAFGSFLNVCVTRWPQGESVVAPRSHCRNCGRTLLWWDNVPLVSWLVLRGRCRTCGARISFRYPLVEFGTGALWALAVWRYPFWDQDFDATRGAAPIFIGLVGQLLFYWLMVALIALDAEHLWLPDWLTLPGIALGVLFALLGAYFSAQSPLNDDLQPGSIVLLHAALRIALSIAAAAGLILLIRGVYWLIRRREGIGLGDAKLMAMLAAWLGLPRSLLSFCLAVVLGALAALVLLALRPSRNSEEHWSAAKLPLGTFLCVGGIVASLWGHLIIKAYLHWAGFY